MQNIITPWVMSPTNDKQYFTSLIEQAIPVGDEVVSKFVKLKPGTYTASDLDRLLRLLDKDYVKHNNEVADSCGTSEYSIPLEMWSQPFRRWVHTIYGGKVSFAYFNVFNFIKKLEKAAKIPPKDAHRWEVTETRACVYDNKIMFDSQKSMRELAGLYKMSTPKGQHYVTFALRDKTLRFSGEGISGISSYSLDGTDLNAPELYFRIEADDLRRLFGQTRVQVFCDSADNLEHPRLLLTSSNGFKVSTNILVPEEVVRELPSVISDY